MRIEIRLTQRCNFNCHYCTDLHNNNVDHVPFDFEGLDHILKNVDDPHVFIYGGEPTTHPECKALTDFLVERDVLTILQTNASQRRVLDTIDKRVVINASFHSSVMSLQKFVHNIAGLNVGEVAFMSDGSDEDYYKLKMVYGDKLQYCPLINDKLDNYEDNESLKSIADTPLFHDVQGDYHFRPHANGVSNYEVWYHNTDSLGVECDVKRNMVHIQDNKVYFCFNAMIAEEDGINMRDYVNTQERVTCPFKKCYFGMENWVA